MARGKSFEHILVGDRLSTWLEAVKLQREGKTSIAVAPTPQNEFNVWPWVPQSEQHHLDRLSEFLGTATYSDAIDRQALSFNEGQPKAFAGFGARKLKSLDFMSPLNQSSKWLPLINEPQNWMAQLQEEFQGHVLEANEVTSLELNNGHLTAVTFNGHQSYELETLYYSESPKQLLELLPPDQPSGRQRQKVGKASYRDVVGLELLHTQAHDDSTGLHFLMGSKDDFSPCLGGFILGSKGTQSVWWSFLEAEDSESEEHVGAQIRYMKRQIKRPYPDAFAEGTREIIRMSQQSWGGADLGLNERRFKGLGNLIMIGPRSVEAHLPLIGEIQSVFGNPEKITSKADLNS